MFYGMSGGRVYVENMTLETGITNSEKKKNSKYYRNQLYNAMFSLSL